jgi:hypothetical protein
MTKFAFASVYITMLTTNWVENDKDAWSFGLLPASAWVNWGFACLVLLMYAWTLVAPLILTDREFD